MQLSVFEVWVTQGLCGLGVDLDGMCWKARLCVWVCTSVCGCLGPCVGVAKGCACVC